jgi:hypothetical protein
MRKSGMNPQTGELFYPTRVSNREYIKSGPENISKKPVEERDKGRRRADKADTEVD